MASISPPPSYQPTAPTPQPSTLGLSGFGDPPFPYPPPANPISRQRQQGTTSTRRTQDTVVQPPTPAFTAAELGTTETPTSVTATARQSIAMSALPLKIQQNLNPTNFVSVVRKSTPGDKKISSSTSIRGIHAVNPYLHIPEALLNRRPSGTLLNNRRNPPTPNRKNLSLDVENGGIDVDIVLVGEGSDGGPPVTLDLNVREGKHRKFPLIARLHTPTRPRRPFNLTAKALDGYTSFHLPASFTGPLTITVKSGDLNDHIMLSKQFLSRSHILNETEFTRCFFVGQLDGWSAGEQEWYGDEVEVEVHSGLVRLQFWGESVWDGVWKFWWNWVINK